MKLSFGKNKDVHDQAVAVEENGGDDGELVRGLSNLYSPQSEAVAHVRDVADVLLELGRITEPQFEEIRAAGSSDPFGRLVLGRQLIEEEQPPGYFRWGGF